MITPVTDALLEALQEHGTCVDRKAIMEVTAEEAERVHAEFLALRAVADTAEAMASTHGVNEPLRLALRDAGRLG